MLSIDVFFNMHYGENNSRIREGYNFRRRNDHQSSDNLFKKRFTLSICISCIFHFLLFKHIISTIIRDSSVSFSVLVYLEILVIFLVSFNVSVKLFSLFTLALEIFGKARKPKITVLFS